MLQKIRARNRLALGLLVFGKLLAIAGLVVAATGSRVVGGSLLAVDALFITAVVVVALVTMKERAADDDPQKAALRQMMKEGTLQQYLRDLEAEESAAACGDASAACAADGEPAAKRQTALS